MKTYTKMQKVEKTLPETFEECENLPCSKCLLGWFIPTDKTMIDDNDFSKCQYRGLLGQLKNENYEEVKNE